MVESTFRLSQRRPKASNYQQELANNVHPSASKAICELAEYVNVQREQIRQLANQVNAAVDELSKLVSVMTMFKGELSSFLKKPDAVELDKRVEEGMTSYDDTAT